MEIIEGLSVSEKKIASRVITKIGTRALRGYSPPADLYPSDMKYLRLARELSYEWIHTMRGAKPEELYPTSAEKHSHTMDYLTHKNGGVRTGFRVTGSVIAMTLEAYKKAVDTENRSVEELVDIQKTPETIDRTILILARKNNETNKLMEESLCLTDGSTELAIKHGDITFRIATSKSGGRYFVPDMIRVIQHHGAELLAEPERADEQCPAQRFLPILWNSMVDIAATDPRFYKTDLESI